MCGVLGAVSTIPIDRDAFGNALNTLRTRGPDGEGIHRSQDGHVSIGHRLLSIVGNNEQQPISNESGSVVASVNGEFYDYAKTRAKLEGRGHRFSTDSDSEILVHLYEESGIACVNDLSGEFAFVLWDAEREILFCARDRFGVKPLVFAKRDDVFLVGSKAKAILEFTNDRRLDVDALVSAVHHQYVAPDETLFAGISTLKPGHTLIFDRRKETVDIQSYNQTHNRRDDGSVADVRATLQQAVERRLQGDHDVGCYLSGGLDSSVIAALVSQRQQGTNAWCASFADDPFDEFRYANLVAQHCGIDLHHIELSPSSVFDVLDDAVYHAEGLAINAHLAAKFLMSRSMKAHGIKVVLTGEGADEVFLGYPHFQQDIGAEVGSTGTAQGVMVGDGSQSLQLTRQLGYTPAFSSAKLGLGKRVSAHTSCDFFHTVDNLDDSAFLKSIAIPTHREHVDRSADLWKNLVLAPYILTTLGDGTEMAHGIEGRTPFLDEDVVLAASRFPVSKMFHEGVEKWPLRAAFRDLLPEEILGRRKQPFIGPPICFQPSAREHLFDRLGMLETSEIWNAHKLRYTYDQIVEEPQEEQRKWEPVFMMALTFEALVRTHNLGIA